MSIKLSPREETVLHLIAVRCLSNKEAAREMKISHRTVENFRHNIMQKMGVKNYGELVRQVALGGSHETVTRSEDQMSLWP